MISCYCFFSLIFFFLTVNCMFMFIFNQLTGIQVSAIYLAEHKIMTFFFVPLIGQSCNFCHFVGIRFQLQKQHEQSGIGTSVQSSCPSNFVSSHLSFFKSLSLHKVPFHLIGPTMTFGQLLILHSVPDQYFKVIYNCMQNFCDSSPSSFPSPKNKMCQVATLIHYELEK